MVAQAASSSKPAAVQSNVRSAMTAPTASTAHAARVPLWVSIPIAAVAPSAYDGHGPAGQQCVESKPRSYEATAGPLTPGDGGTCQGMSHPRGHSESGPTRPRGEHLLTSEKTSTSSALCVR